MSDAIEQPSLRADARANREALLDAAAELFAERGIDVSYEEIADRASVSRATLYRHFANRDALLAGLLDRLLTELEGAVSEFAGRPDGLFELFDFCVRAQQNHLPIVDLANQRRGEPELERSRRRFETLLRGPLAEAQAAGLVAPELTIVDVRLLLTMLFSVNRDSFSDADRGRAARLARTALAAPRPLSSR